MRHFIITLAIVLASLTLAAREVTKNPVTKMVLTENLGVYSITGPDGTLVLGNEEQSRNFFNQAAKVFTINAGNRLLDIENSKYSLKKDDQGYYLVKVGLGGVKLRYSDVYLFASHFDIKLGIETGKEVVKEGKGKLQEIWKAVTKQ